MNTIHTFVNEWCERAASEREATVRTWQAYLLWCNTKKQPPVKPEEFLGALWKEGLALSAGYVQGIRLTEASRTLLDEHTRSAEEPGGR